MKRIQTIYNIVIALIIGTLVVCYLGERRKSPVVTVDIEYLVKSITKDSAKWDLPQEKLEEEVKAILSELEEHINEISKQRKVVVIISKAVIAGAPDITEELAGKLRGTK